MEVFLLKSPILQFPAYVICSSRIKSAQEE